MYSLSAIPANGNRLKWILRRGLQIYNDFSLFAGIEQSSELWPRIPSDKLIAGREAKSDSAGTSRASVEDLEDAIPIRFHQELNPKKGLLGQKPLSAVDPHRGPGSAGGERCETNAY